MNARQADVVNSQSARVRLFFDQTSDEKFLVLAEVLSTETSEQANQLSVHTFEHEDRFLERLILADLHNDDTSLLAGTVIRSVDQSLRTRNWMELTLTGDQIAALGLESERFVAEADATAKSLELAAKSSDFNFSDSSQFYQFLIHSPTPFVMLSGPEHRFTFINQPYVELIGKTTQQEVLMKTVREVLPELEGQLFFKWLDEVYATGEQHIGKEQLAHMRSPRGLGFEERYFDSVYYPVRNVQGKVYGVMVQAADVTERVRSEAVSEHREETLFRQWAELDSIYRTAPIGMALLDVKSLKLLRINEKQAEIMGAPVSELLGKRALDLKSVPPSLLQLFKRLEAGGTVCNALVEKAVVPGATGHRTWLVSISPFLGASGEPVAYTSISLEIPDEP